MVVALLSCVSHIVGAETPWDTSTQDSPVVLKSHSTTLNRLHEIGTSYHARVLATLDLSKRAQLELNCFTDIVDPNFNFEMYFVGYFNQTDLPRFLFTLPLWAAAKPRRWRRCVLKG